METNELLLLLVAGRQLLSRGLAYLELSERMASEGRTKLTPEEREQAKARRAETRDQLVEAIEKGKAEGR